jgi:hypothetical protein
MGGPLLPALDTFVLVIPFVVILAMGMFGLDERFVSRGRTPKRRSFCEVGGEGRHFVSDPDGKPWKKYPQRQIEARIIHSQAPGARESRLEGAHSGRRRIVTIM